HLALYVLYELYYASFEGVADGWEWEPSLIALRATLERAFEAELEQLAGGAAAPAAERVGDELVELVRADDGPPLARYVETRATLDQVLELVVCRSVYNLKEADPHSWALPRLRGAPKSALVEIQADEYGGGRPDRMHAVLFAASMDALGLDSRYGAYLDVVPGIGLASVNLMSLFGLQRRWRGAIVGHLAAFEMTSSQPNRRYAGGLRRLGFGSEATEFFDEHVEADAVHENIAAFDMAGGLARQQPELAGDILFGARCLLALEAEAARRMLEAWERGEPALLRPLRAVVAAGLSR
ncbi:MAG TPA: iron-containing redox enzyme family protein, partial [Gemmatimonadaceae bacterium]|nr:iron-containing redox enzyme family protein [Gemmatimonadaceae bacterium]